MQSPKKCMVVHGKSGKLANDPTKQRPIPQSSVVLYAFWRKSTLYKSLLYCNHTFPYRQLVACQKVTLQNKGFPQCRAQNRLQEKLRVIFIDWQKRVILKPLNIIESKEILLVRNDDWNEISRCFCQNVSKTRRKKILFSFTLT